MPTHQIRSVPVEEWPAPDRSAWESACRPGGRLARGGAAAHLKPITRADLARRYGYFLDHLRRHDVPLSTGEPAGQVRPEHVEAYLAELQGRVGSVTVYRSIQKLRRAAELIARDKDLEWLREIENDLDFLKTPRSKYPRLVTTTALVEAGLTLLAEAEIKPQEPAYRSLRREGWAALRRARGAAEREPLSRAVLARNGLMLALLALCPIRIKNFAALQIGMSVQKVGSTWWIVLTPDETKSRRADERPVPELLTPALDLYVGHHRSILARRKLQPSSGALWVSSQTGDPMPQSSVEGAIRHATEMTLGIEVGPHMFRTAAATSAAIRASKLPGLASAVLQHVEPRITEQHYNRASSHQAAQAYAATLRIETSAKRT